MARLRLSKVFEPDEDVSERVARAISAYGSQAKLARRLGVSTATVSLWTVGRGQAGWLRLRQICRTLGVSADYLLGLSEDPRPRDDPPGSEHVIEVVVRTRHDQIEEATARRVRRSKVGV